MILLDCYLNVLFGTFLFIFVLSRASGLKSRIFAVAIMQNVLYTPDTKGLTYQKFVPSEYKEHVLTPEFQSELEILINNSFKTEGKELVHGYFSLQHLFGNNRLEYIIKVLDHENNYNIVGALIAFSQHVDGIKFVLYDKIVVLPKYRGRDACGRMISFARMLDAEKPRRDCQIAALRTSNKKRDEKYTKLFKEMFGNNYYRYEVANPEAQVTYFVHVFWEPNLDMQCDAAKRVAQFVAEQKPTLREFNQKLY